MVFDFSGLGRGIAAGAQGYLAGETKGEGEVYRRSQQANANDLRRLLAASRMKTPKEELPYDIKAVVDEDLYMRTKASAEEKNQYEQSGRANVVRGTLHALSAYPNDFGKVRAAHTYLSSPDTTNVTDLAGQLGIRHPDPTIGHPTGGEFEQAAAGGAYGAVGPAGAPQPSPNQGTGLPPWLQPAGSPNFNYTPPALEQAKTVDTLANAGLATAHTEQVRVMTPLEADHLQAQTKGIGDQFDLQKRRLNFDLAQKDFDNSLSLFKQYVKMGQDDLQNQTDLYGKLLNASIKLHASGGNPAAALRPLLHDADKLGATTINPVVAIKMLQDSGYSPTAIHDILGAAPALSGQGMNTPIPGYTPGGAGTAPGPNLGGGAAPPAGPGGVPVLPQAGTTAAPTPGGPAYSGPLGTASRGAGGNLADSRARLAAAVQGGGAGGGTPAAEMSAFATGLGFRTTSTTGGQHNPGSAHYQGRAVDVGVRGKNPAEVQQFMQQAAAQGYLVRDERTRPAGQRVWSGPHIHLEVPAGGTSQLASRGGGGAPAPETTTPEPAATTTTTTTGGGPAQGAADFGLKTPATAAPVRNPYPPNSGESRIFELHAKGVTSQEIQAQFKGTPYAEMAARVIDDMQAAQTANLMPGLPTASRLGARAPNNTNFAGALGYQDVGNPQVTTTPAPEPNAGFNPPPTPTPAPAPPSAATPPATNPATPAARIFPAKPPAKTAPSPPSKTTPGAGGPSLFGMPQGQRDQGTPQRTTTTPEKGLPGVLGSPRRQTSAVSTLPVVGGPSKQTLDTQAARDREGLNQAATKEATREVERFRKNFEYSPAVERYLKAKGIAQPTEQAFVYAHVRDRIAKLYQSGHTPRQVKALLAAELSGATAKKVAAR